MLIPAARSLSHPRPRSAVRPLAALRPSTPDRRGPRRASWAGVAQAAADAAQRVARQATAAAAALLLAASPTLESPAQAFPASEVVARAPDSGGDWLAAYGSYVKGQLLREQAPGCELCRTNRLMLEGTWETISSEFFDPRDQFSEEQWARELLEALQAAGGTLPTKHTTYQALQRLVASLGDPYSQFLPPLRFREAIHQPRPVERQYLAMQYVASGVVLGGHSALGGWYVEAALAESPAEEAGVRRGDRIQTINGENVDRLSAAEVAALLRGPGGTSVELGLVNAVGNARWVELTRRALPQPPVRQADLIAPGGHAVKYIRVHYFAAPTPAAVREAMEQGEREGVFGYVLDLRNNPGGSFDAAIEVASLFLPEGAPITTTVRRGGALDGAWVAGQLLLEGVSDQPQSALSARPLFLLTNASTASASEVLAGALRDNGRAHLVGERTFGKGVVQGYFGERDGSGLKLTVAKYITPSGYDITRQGGLAPDEGLTCHDHPRGLTGLPDLCMAKALRGIAALDQGAAS